MSVPAYLGRPAIQCLRHTSKSKSSWTQLCNGRSFATTLSSQAEASLESTSSPPPLDPALVSTPREERRLIRSGVMPIGSRRRRAALQNSSNIPFEQLPYQCFQEARKILQADREEKLKQIEVQRRRIEKAQAAYNASPDASQKGRLMAMQKHLEELKILADINDPMIKKRFEDGEGDMNRPIYRYLADQEWREYRRRVLMQRITQMSVVPDVLPHVDPTAEVGLGFRRRKVHPGDFVDSRVSEVPPRLTVQVFDKGERLVSVVVVDSDVPNLETDGFGYRCHFFAANIPISPTSTSLPFSRLSPEAQIVLPWLPPYAQKGSPYHRYPVFVLQQPEGKSLDVAALRERVERDGFNLRGFNDRYAVKPIGVHLFRCIWDEGTAGVMRRAGVEGANIEFRRKKPEKMPYRKKDGARYR